MWRSFIVGLVLVELKMVFGVMVMCYVTSGEMGNGIG